MQRFSLVVSKAILRLTCLGVLCLAFGMTYAEEPVLNYPTPGEMAPAGEKIGIFDLTLIHEPPLDAEVIGTREEDGVVIEEIRFTGRPGVRVYMLMAYLKGAVKRPVTLALLNAGTQTPFNEAKNGFVGLSVCPPSGNSDETQKLTVGGPPFNQFYTDDPEDSWFYHYVVALTRAFDYLETRPEADMSKIMVTGFSTAGYVANLLHAIENRPSGYITYHGSGYFTEPDGTSGGEPAYLTRKQYEMYGPAAYAAHGTSPLYICSAVSDYFAMFDGLIEIYTQLRCPKRLTVAPNRGHKQTDRKEFRNVWPWMTHWLFAGPAMPVVEDGIVEIRDGRLIYTFTSDAPAAQIQHADVLYSYGKPGLWAGRTWHRSPATRTATGAYEYEIPVYDLTTPLYAVAQIETRDLGNVANTPQFIDPLAMKLPQATASYPRMLIDFESQDDLYVPEGVVRYVTDSAEGKFAAAITPFDDGTVHLVNIETAVRAGGKELRIFLKGNGKVNTLLAFYSDDRDFWKYPPVATLVDNAVFPNTWKQYVIPLSGFEKPERITRLVLKLSTPTEIFVDGLYWL